MNPPSKPATSIFLYVLVALSILLNFYLLFENRKLQGPSQVVPSTPPTSASPVTAAPPSSLPATPAINNQKLWIVVKNRDLLSVDAMGQTQAITQTGGVVFAFDYTADLTSVAYITGVKKTNEYNADWIEPNVVNFQKIGDTHAQEIFRLERKTSPGAEYAVELKDVRFSPDGKLLGITSSDSFWTYNTVTQSLNQIFTSPMDPTSRNLQVWAYSNPVFSPDNTKVFLTNGYYEGSGISWVDLATKTNTSLPYTAYVSGSVVSGWHSNQEFLLLEYPEPESTAPSTLSIVNLAGLQKTKSFPIPDRTFSGLKSNDKVYLQAQVQQKTGTSAQGYDLFDQLDEIIELNMSTGKQHTVYTRNSSKSNAYLRKMKLGNLNTLLLDLSTPQNKHVVNKLTLSDSQPQATLMVDDASL